MLQDVLKNKQNKAILIIVMILTIGHASIGELRNAFIQTESKRYTKKKKKKKRLKDELKNSKQSLCSSQLILLLL